MPTSITEIKGFLDEEGLHYQHVEDELCISTGFLTENYINKNGNNQIPFKINCEENGELIRIVAYNVFELPLKLNAKERAMVLQTLAQVNWTSKLVSFDWDSNDGEIRASVLLPLEDAPLTRKQLIRGVSSLVGIVDEYSSDICRALHQGIPLEGQRVYAEKFRKYLRQRSATPAP